MIKKALIYLINLYQRTISPDHGWLFRSRYPNGFCRYYPSCSEYAKLAIEKHGALHGLAKGFVRVIKCNPFSKGGLDPV
jgi:hypothetical protein